MDVEKPLWGALIQGGLSRPSWPFALLLLTVLAVLSLQITTNAVFPTWAGGSGLRQEKTFSSSSGGDSQPTTCAGFFREGPERKVVMSVADFGGVGDGTTSNTAAFRRAVEHAVRLGKERGGGGGAQLNVPRGRWVTGSFNLTSNFTLFLEEGAVILGSQDPKEWPIIEALPSYGRGRERLGGRHISLIHGDGLNDVVITGENGTIDGQGKMWWEMWWNRTLKHTRGHLLELMNSNNILISNLTFRNSPFWTIHPVYCSNIVIKNMTVLAPLNAPNTDGIDPESTSGDLQFNFYTDSSTNVCIEDCYIESGDDLVAVKSGWDQYGIGMARPSSNIILRRVSGTTPTCSGVGIGSEMSGGVSNVIVENVHIRDSAAGIRMKTDKGRGGYVANITISNITMERVKMPIRFSRGANDHPDEGWDPKAVPIVKGIFISNVVSRDSVRAPLLEGIEGAPYEGICMRNVTVLGLGASAKWSCEFVSGFSDGVSPVPCPQLQSNRSASSCSFS
ncbi:probable polygalacturonase isoform X2 [Rhododendron vialii]|uniref:probable polygalacturonase isoform X2 n=1 Tax=Rhododendron vialii TaxID=182163 RepID=UPI00265EA8AF|nr:probable polygalacturonase isoform X2 [Rhododendron vialii]